MNENYEELKELFNKIKRKGWIKAHRTGNTGIGKTFEDLLDKKEDNLYNTLNQLIEHYKTNSKIKIDIDFNPIHI